MSPAVRLRSTEQFATGEPTVVVANAALATRVPPDGAASWAAVWFSQILHLRDPVVPESKFA